MLVERIRRTLEQDRQTLAWMKAHNINRAAIAEQAHRVAYHERILTRAGVAQG